jgi:uncharacterized protein
MKRQIVQRTLSERAVAGGKQIALEFQSGKLPEIPATLLLPERTPAPGALLIHGYSSRKEHMADSVGRGLLSRSIASLSIDLPLHGTRQDPIARQALGNPLELMRHWRAAVAETRLAIEYLRARPEIDSGRLAVVGYSLGSFLATLLAAENAAVRALVVAAGGDLPTGSAFTTIARTLVDPVRAVRKLKGRPLLVVHGRRDRTVLPEQAQRLYDAADEPKEIRWWDSGHYLPEAAIDQAADWLAEQLR